MDNFYVRDERQHNRHDDGGNPPRWVGVSHDYNLRPRSGDVPLVVSMKGKIKVYVDGKGRQIVLKKKN